MAVASEQVDVGTTATQLTAASTDSVSGYRICVKNPSDSGGSVYLGADDVTDTTGFELAAGESFDDEFNQGESLYAVTASGTVTVHVYRGGV